MIQKITQAEIDENAVSALSDRPGAPSRYGTGGLSAGALKARFDALALLAITKLNALIDALHGAGEGDPLVDEMVTHAVSLLDENERIPLSAWMTRVETFLGLSGTGGLAARVAALEALHIPDDVPTLLSGLHPDLVAGLAQNLCGRPNDVTGVRFTYRPTRDAGDVGKGNAKIKSIHGSTLLWNQLIQNGNFADTSVWTTSAATLSASGNVGTMTATADNGYINHTFNTIAGHRYLCLATLKSAATHFRLRVYYNNLGSNQSSNLSHANAKETVYITFTETTSGTNNVFRITTTYNEGNGESVDVENCMVFDLTRMFGAGQEPTADAFRALFPLPYYAYDAGRLLHFAGTGLVTTGFNQWDEQTRVGTYSLSTGAYDGTATDRLCSANLTAVIPDTAYHFKTKAGLTGGNVCFYDRDKCFIGSVPNRGNSRFTTPVGCAFINISLGLAYGTTYQNDVCVSLAWSGWRNGEYEPYRESTLALPVADYFEGGMKSVGAVFDELTKTKAVQRIGTRAYAAGDESDATVVTDGTTTCYVLDEPVETAVELDLTYRADDFGTEKLLPENGTSPTTSPLTGRVLYALNAVDTVRNLPKNYISLATFDKLRTALAGDYTITRTYNATTNDYDVTVTRVGGVWRHRLSVKNSDDEWLDFAAIAGSATQAAYDDGAGKFTGLPDGCYAAVSADYGAGTAVVSGGVLTFYYGSSSKVWNGSGGVQDAVTKLY